MSLKPQIAFGLGLALLAATPCFAFSIVSTPVINDNSALAKHFGAAGGSYFQDANPTQAPTDRANQHGAMVVYDLGSSASKSASALDRRAIADHSADPRFNPFLQDDDASAPTPPTAAAPPAQP